MQRLPFPFYRSNVLETLTHPIITDGTCLLVFNINKALL